MKLKVKGQKSKVIVVVGPTASGKSELAVRLAKKFNGEIISADSRQVYRGLDIGSGKIIGKWKLSRGNPTSVGSRTSKIFVYGGISHHCIDFVSPKKTYTAAEYKKCAEAAIKDITDRGKIPILAGGTAFWINAVAYDLNLPPVRPNPELRKQLEKKSASELLKILRKLDPRRAKTIEQKNPRRLIRAIEIAKALGGVPPIKKKSAYRMLWLGLNPPYETWSRKVKNRVRKMIQRGLIQETKKLLGQGLGRKRIKEFGFEYRAALDFIDKKVSREEFLERMVRDTLRYARRQMLWWRRNSALHWAVNERSAEELAQKFIPS